MTISSLMDASGPARPGRVLSQGTPGACQERRVATRSRLPSGSSGSHSRRQVEANVPSRQGTRVARTRPQPAPRPRQTEQEQPPRPSGRRYRASPTGPRTSFGRVRVSRHVFSREPPPWHGRRSRESDHLAATTQFAAATDMAVAAHVNSPCQAAEGRTPERKAKRARDEWARLGSNRRRDRHGGRGSRSTRPARRPKAAHPSGKRSGRGTSGRGWDRTSDLPRVKRALSR